MNGSTLVSVWMSQGIVRKSAELNAGRSETNATDWRYLLPQSPNPPYLHVIGSEGGLPGANCDLRGERVETFIPLWSGEPRAMGSLKDVSVKEGSYSLVVWELEIGPSLWHDPSMRLSGAVNEVRDLIAKDGFIYVAARRKVGGFVGIREIGELLRGAGFHGCRAYYVLPSHFYPMHFVEANNACLMRYYLYHVASARSRKRKLMAGLARALIQLKLDRSFPFLIPCLSIVAHR